MVVVLASLLLLAALAAAVAAALAGAPASPLDEEFAWEGETGAFRAAHARWQELAQARDWESLHAQLHRWQELATPGWSEADIEKVARSLNRAVFRFAEPAR